MNHQNDRANTAVKTPIAGVNPIAGPIDRASGFIMMVNNPDTKQDDDQEGNQPGNLPAEIPVTEPLTPVPAQDEVNPPLKSTLGGDDVVIPLEK